MNITAAAAQHLSPPLPANWACTVCDSCDPSTTLSRGASVVNTVSKLDTSCETPSQHEARADTGDRLDRTHHWARHARLERRLDLLLDELLEVDVVCKEGVRSDLLRSVDSETLRRVSREETGEDTAGLDPAIVSKYQRIRQNLLVHDIGVLC